MAQPVAQTRLTQASPSHSRVGMRAGSAPPRPLASERTTWPVCPAGAFLWRCRPWRLPLPKKPLVLTTSVQELECSPCRPPCPPRLPPLTLAYRCCACLPAWTRAQPMQRCPLFTPARAACRRYRSACRAGCMGPPGSTRRCWSCLSPPLRASSSTRWSRCVVLPCGAHACLRCREEEGGGKLLLCCTRGCSP
jgi:hypothetical protein